MTTWLHSLLHLFYPQLCAACGENLPPKTDLLCLACELQLPTTEQYLQAENAFTELFWGRVSVEAAAAQYYFSKSGRVQHLIHQLKYQGKSVVGYELGVIFGRQLREQAHFQEIDAVVPVPLHPKKKHLRGYNQAEAFGQGLAESMDLPILPDLLHRKVFTNTQTKKTRLERLENVMTAFGLKDPSAASEKHLLLVDDVLTTGATLEACALQLLQAEGVKISMATIAIAD